jgi:uncharacterized membrane protein YhdT
MLRYDTNQKQVGARELMIVILVLGSVIAVKEGYTGNGKWYGLLTLTLPLLLFAIINIRQKKREGKGE